MTDKRLRTVFLGTPSFAVPSLEAVATHADVLAVITQPEKPAGRGRRIAAPPVAEAAKTLGLTTIQPPRLKGPDVLSRLDRLAPDVIVTVAYGKIIPKDILELPPLGCINLHPSLLPKYRGASPIPRAIEAGEAVTGVTIMYQSEALDAGDIILQREVPIEPTDTTHTLEDRLARIGAEALVEALTLIAEGRAPRTPQDESAAKYVGKLTKADGEIDWTKPAAVLERFIRAMDPWPSAYSAHRGRLLKIWKSTVIPDGPGRAPATVVEIRRGEGFVVATGAGMLLVREVQPEGGRRMTAEEYARGARLKAREQLGAPPAVNAGSG